MEETELSTSKRWMASQFFKNPLNYCHLFFLFLPKRVEEEMNENHSAFKTPTFFFGNRRRFREENTKQKNDDGHF